MNSHRPSRSPQALLQHPDSIAAHHWQEWLDSGISPSLITANLRSLDGDQPYDYLCSAPQLPRTNSGRLASHLLRRYRHTESGGWWCQGLDPLNGWQAMLWGCFKPDAPRQDDQRGKLIKYEHPLKTPTRAFFLDNPENPSFWPNIQADPTAPIVVVEGAKKAAALLSLGYAAIALPGVFNGRRVMRDEWGKVYAESLIPELTAFMQPGRPVYFCFDHDSKASTQRQVNLAIAATGRLLEKAGSVVQVISLPGPEKGVDDFLVAHGADAFATLFEQAPPLAVWQWQHQKRLELTLTPAQTVNQSEFAPTGIPDRGVIVFASPKGTGKTKAIVDLVADKPRVVALGHRISLMRNLCDRMGLDYRGDLDEFQGRVFSDAGVTHRIGLCVDSLGKIKPEEFVGGVVVIDEFMQVLRHLLTSPTCNQNGKRPVLLAKFAQILRVADQIILADADAADLGIHYIHNLANQNRAGQTPNNPNPNNPNPNNPNPDNPNPDNPLPIHLIRNDYQPQGFPVRFLEAHQDDAIVAEILADIQAGRKIFIATDSLKGSAALKKLIDNLETRPRGLIINSQTSGGTEERAFITDPNNAVHDYDWIVATPSLSTGVSIEVEHFEKVYGLFYGVITDADAAQALNRVRPNVPRTVWAAKRGKNFNPISRSTNHRELDRILKTKTDLTAMLLKVSLGCPDTVLPEMFELIWQQNPHLQLFTRIAAKSNQALWILRDGLLARLLLEGNQVERVKFDQNDGPIDSPMKQARKEVKVEHFRAVAQAQILSRTELETLERQETLSPDDQLNIEKTHAADFLALDLSHGLAVEPEQIEFVSQYRLQILQLEALLQGAELAVKRDVEALNRQVQWGQGFMPSDQPFNELRRFVRDRIGLLDYLKPGVEWSDTDLAPLGEMVRSHRQQVKEILGFNIPEAEKYASNGWIFQMLCQQLGLKVKSCRRGGRDQQVKFFYIEVQQFEAVMAVVDRRQQRRAIAQRLAEDYRLDGLPETASLSETTVAEAIPAVVTPSSLYKTDGGNYGYSPTAKELPAIEQKNQNNPYLAIGQRVKGQIQNLVNGLRGMSLEILPMRNGAMRC
jgi:hypothetical protein